jgi:hypothetical protein
MLIVGILVDGLFVSLFWKMICVLALVLFSPA